VRLDPCNARAHVVRASLFMPRFADAGHVDGDSVWVHLHRAVRCDARDGNAWSDVRSRVRAAWLPDDRPGEWMYHCHILEHHASGMMGHFEVIAWRATGCGRLRARG
jgi:FtsP/CotA-like multicopper oxidase with cupredoxin domain